MKRRGFFGALTQNPLRNEGDFRGSAGGLCMAASRAIACECPKYIASFVEGKLVFRKGRDPHPLGHCRTCGGRLP